MNIKILSFDFSESAMFAKALQIRTIVFVEEQNVPAALEYDGKDSEAKHYLLYLDNEPVATARFRFTHNGIKLERFAVLNHLRNLGLGKLLLDKIISDISDLQLNIYLHSQESAVNFYKRNNFVCEGEKFFEAGIGHYKMVFVK